MGVSDHCFGSKCTSTLGKGQQRTAQPPLGSEGHRAPSEDSLAGGEGREGWKVGKFTLFNPRHPGEAIDTSTGNKKSLDLDLQR